jgi:hypothetical protein
MFKRLNAGGSPAEAHEIRNASLRIAGDAGERFLDFLGKCAKDTNFREVTETLSDQAKQRLGREELVLRFFALKQSISTYKGNISDWLDSFSESVAKETVSFNYEAEHETFVKAFKVFADKFGPDAFVKHKGGRALGGLAPAYYDAVTMGLMPLIERLSKATLDAAKSILNEAVGHENSSFRENVGPGANAVPRLHKRIEEVRKKFESQLPS